MSEKTMIERVTEAVKAAICSAGDDDFYPFIAKAAIEAMRTPTEAVLVEIADSMGGHSGTWDAERVWQAGIDEALRDQT